MYDLIENIICWFLRYGTIVINILLLILIYYINKLIKKINNVKQQAQSSNEALCAIFSTEIKGIKQSYNKLQEESKQEMELLKALYESKILAQVEIINSKLLTINKEIKKHDDYFNKLKKNITTDGIENKSIADEVKDIKKDILMSIIMLSSITASSSASEYRIFKIVKNSFYHLGKRYFPKPDNAAQAESMGFDNFNSQLELINNSDNYHIIKNSLSYFAQSHANYITSSNKKEDIERIMETNNIKIELPNLYYLD